MALHGPEFYDNETVFTTYAARRARQGDNPNDILEKPVFDELAGPLKDLRILDLGCGAALFGREAWQQGCSAYLGIDGSHKMIEQAQNNLLETPQTIQVRQAAIESWDYPLQQFDLVASRLALHYIEDIEALFARVYHTLAEHGRFIFSIEHPVITSSDQAWKSGDKRQHWIVDDYFETGPRTTSWMGGQVVKYHRTVEDYFTALRRAKFTIDDLRESRPQRALFPDEASYTRRKRIPLMLFFAARKVG